MVTFVALGAGAAGVVALSLLGTWSVTTWWSALSGWAPISVLVTLAAILGRQLQLTHTALGAVQLVRTGGPSAGRGRRALVVVVSWLACLGWFTATVLLPGA